MPQTLEIADFLNAPGVLLDVRSPGEYTEGHIPGAVSFPLFSNEERSQVGICYKEQGHDAAVELGLAIVAPQLVNFVKAAKQLVPDRRVRMHCWRGGMRSGSMAWLLETAGFEVTTLVGGYKAFRRWVRETCAAPRPIVTLGGMTGSGKTAILQELAAQGAQILDLEACANHRGSSFGALGLDPQPTNEQFENQVAIAWAELSPDRLVWIEAESRRIGLCRVPDELFSQMLVAPVLQVTRSRAERVAILVQVYSVAPIAELITATERIGKKLGGQHAKAAIAHLRDQRLAEACDLILNYYDKTYQYDLQRRNVPVHTIDVSGQSDAEAATVLLAEADRLFSSAPLSAPIMALSP